MDLYGDDNQAKYPAQSHLKKYQINYPDVDDLAFKNRHDPNFIASISAFFARAILRHLGVR